MTKQMQKTVVIDGVTYNRQDVQILAVVGKDFSTITRSLDSIQEELNSAKQAMQAIKDRIIPPHVYNKIKIESEAVLKEYIEIEKELKSILKNAKKLSKEENESAGNKENESADRDIFLVK